MANSERQKLNEFWNEVRDHYKQERLSNLMLKAYISALEDYSIDQLEYAFGCHLKDPKLCGFCPEPGQLLKYLEGGSISPDEIIACARMRNTPLGCLSSMIIGTYDLNNADAWYLKQRAEMVLQRLPELKSRFNSGDLTDREIEVMLKHKVNPSSVFYKNHSPPARSEQFMQRAKRIYQNPNRDRLESDKPKDLPKIEAMPENIKQKIIELKNSLPSIDSAIGGALCSSSGCINEQYRSEHYSITGLGRVCFECFNRYAINEVAAQLDKK